MAPAWRLLHVSRRVTLDFASVFHVFSLMSIFDYRLPRGCFYVLFGDWACQRPKVIQRSEVQYPYLSNFLPGSLSLSITQVHCFALKHKLPPWSIFTSHDSPSSPHLPFSRCRCRSSFGTQPCPHAANDSAGVVLSYLAILSLVEKLKSTPSISLSLD